MFTGLMNKDDLVPAVPAALHSALRAAGACVFCRGPAGGWPVGRRSPGAPAPTQNEGAEERAAGVKVTRYLVPGSTGRARGFAAD